MGEKIMVADKTPAFAELFIYRAYEKDGVYYLPHYTESCYVGPGPNGTVKHYDELDLVVAGAKIVNLDLWKRKEFREI
jgi:hypothetical protein